MATIKKLSSVCIGILLALVGAQTVQAQSSISEEAILSYLGGIRVNTDNSINVIETITYVTGPQEHHGIYRDIYPYSSEGRKMGIEDISVTDEGGVSYQYEVSHEGKNIRIKIGDPNVTFAGQKTYVIQYKATKAVAQLNDADEIYWNVTGNDWGMPIYQAKASIALPEGVTASQSACYYGEKGSTNLCTVDDQERGMKTFSAPGILAPGEGLTVAAGFPKGVVAPYSAGDNTSKFFTIYWTWMVGIALPLITLWLSLRYWLKKGRDAKGTGVIIPQYEVLDKLTPMEVIGIVEEKIPTPAISAEIIYLATQGYVKINQIEKSAVLRLFKSTDYELIKLKDSDDLPNAFDRMLMDSLFSSGKTSVKLSDLKNIFYKKIQPITASAVTALFTKGYYKNLGRMKIGGTTSIVAILFIGIWMASIFGGFIGGLILQGNPLPLGLGVFLSIIIFGITYHVSPAKSAKGVAAKEYILGLKEYLRIAEKDRLQFHNAPEKKPEIFEQLLPYAMTLGVAAIWAKEFEGIYTTPPSWYSSSTGAHFSAMAFSNDISSFSSFTASTLASSPGGSGGGGSSGGGGGGGGGGSW